MEKFQELLQVDVSGLIKGAFEKKGIPGAAKKKEIAIGRGVVKLGVELSSVLFEEVMAAGIKAGRIEGPHEGNNEVSHAAGQGLLL